MINVVGGQGFWEFVFIGWYSLVDVCFIEFIDGWLIWMMLIQEMKGVYVGEYFISKVIMIRCFFFCEYYEGKVNKWIEDIVKVRIEGRFLEKEWEDFVWILCFVKMQDVQFGLYVVVFQEGVY